MALDYKIAAIDTQYNERRYRSRLEAKWAAFFDLCGWRAEYEPFDLGEWSPDFLIKGWRTEILVEVKPITAIDVPTIWKMHTAAEKAGFKGELLLVGTYPTSVLLGWMCTNEIPDSPDCSNERQGYPREMRMTPWFIRAEFTDTHKPDFSVGVCLNTSRGGLDWGTGTIQHGKPRRTLLMWDVPPKHYDPEKIWSNAANAVRWRGR